MSQRLLCRELAGVDEVAANHCSSAALAGFTVHAGDVVLVCDASERRVRQDRASTGHTALQRRRTHVVTATPVMTRKTVGSSRAGTGCGRRIQSAHTGRSGRQTRASPSFLSLLPPVEGVSWIRVGKSEEVRDWDRGRRTRSQSRAVAPHRVWHRRPRQ